MDPADAPHLAARMGQNVAALRARIEAARARSPRAAAGVQLLVITKSAPAAWLPALARVGVTEVGENRVPGLSGRRPPPPTSLRWHLVGHLQRNKAQRAVANFEVFHALDSLRLARHLDRLRLEAGQRPWPVYLQVNASGEDQKEGVLPEAALPLLREVLTFPHLLPVGFMTLGRHPAEEGELRRTFRTLADLRNEAQQLGLGDPPPVGLSMGMSEDFEVAVEEGATVVRVGRAVFAGLDSEHDGHGATGRSA